jgi:hypothetical protein
VAADDRAKSRSSWSRLEVIASVVVVLMIISVYLYFRG